MKGKPNILFNHFVNFMASWNIIATMIYRLVA